MGRDAAGRTVIQLAADDWVLERLLTFDADAVELEDGGDAEPDVDDEDGLPVLCLNQVPPRQLYARRQ